jgi:acyl-CoA reductase-like NAD-dependent aldehyde dehydrogenase
MARLGGATHRSTSWRRRRRSARHRHRRVADDVEHAVAAARNAFLAWRDVPAQQRARAIRAAAAILIANADELAWLEALDTGNPFQAMRYDVEISVGYMEYFAGLVTEIKGDTIPIGRARSTTRCASRSASVGRIGAFNHPLLFTAGKCGAPLATGNTLVVKPADQTPLSVAADRRAVADVFRPGVFNVVTGRRMRARAGAPSEGGEDRLHRQRRGRPRGDGRRRGDAQGADARARRQERADRSVPDAAPAEVADGSFAA